MPEPENPHLRHWSALEHTDPTATKPFDRGRFKGTATKPIWNERLMTEHFGPCGIGWGMNEPAFNLVPAGDELLVYCTVAIWYRDDDAGTVGTVYGVGGDKVLRVEKNGPFISDEAYKAAFTDAIGNGIKHLGVNADIHMGEFDHKYADRPTQERRDPLPRAATRDAPSAGAAPSASSNTGSRGNGALATRTPRQARDEIRAAIEKANTAKQIDDIIKLNTADLVRIRGAKNGIPAYDELMQFATARQGELRASA